MNPSRIYDQILIATTNSGKALEIATLLDGCAKEFLTLKDLPALDEPIEDGVSFLENSMIKSRYYALHSGLPSVADDSGLTVDALDGFPGVQSARMAGEDASDDQRNIKLLEIMADILDAERRGSFVCAASFVDPVKGIELSTSGRLDGTIGFTQDGNEGFGFDPLFIPDGYDKSLASLGLSIKNEISHRHKAFHELAKKILASSI